MWRPKFNRWIYIFLWASAHLFLTCGWLTHWGRATHICGGKLTIIGSDNGLSPGRREAIIWTIVGILFIGPLGTNFSEILIEINVFSFMKMRLKMSSGKWRPSCLGLNVLKTWPTKSQVMSLEVLMATFEGPCWGRLTQICISNLTIIGSDNDLSPCRRQAIICTNGGILLIGPSRTNFSEILIEIQVLSFKKMHLRYDDHFVSASMCWPACLCFVS